MKKFYFSLDTVLRYKEQVLEGLRGEHARTLAKVRECEREIEELVREYADVGRMLEEGRFRGMTIQDIRSYTNYMEVLNIRRKRKEDELVKLRIAEEKKREEVVEAKKETSSIEKLKERKQEEYNKLVQKQEEQAIEEFVSTKSAMAKLSADNQ